MKTLWFCKTCSDEVEMHYDHVERCSPPSSCTGTFSHLPASTCPRRYITLKHQDVRSETRP